MNKNCAGCGKPVYFAERKTSLGREWHPSCLKCVECGRVLSPGQHAEHKGMPYCHHPCYRALFGPAILGYGSNISSPANFGPRKDRSSNAAALNGSNRASTGSIVGSVLSEESASHSYSLGRRNKPKHFLVHQNSNGVRTSASSASGSTDTRNLRDPISANAQVTRTPHAVASNNTYRSIKYYPVPSPTHSSSPSSSPTPPTSSSSSKQPPPPPPPPQSSSSSTSESLSSSTPLSKQDPAVIASSRLSMERKLDKSLAAVDDCRFLTPLSPSDEDSESKQSLLPRSISNSSPRSTHRSAGENSQMAGQEMLGKLEDFNKYYEGKVHHQMRAEQRDDGSVFVEGPLRVYWGLSRPIQLAHCDNIPPAPISQWRHSLAVGTDSPMETSNRTFATTSLRRTGSPARKSRDLDDLLSPTSSDDVVRRKKGGVRKFKTVAYRGGDQPSKWKRASINGHIFNFDTSVFTPVLGSCTSVTVDGTLNSLEVIETLLDKFKVQNSADEYVLSIVNEEGERLLTNRDRPLLERLKLGPDETIGKIFIKEREVLHEKGVGELVVSANVKASLAAEDVDSTDDGGSGSSLTRGMRSSSIKMPIRETEEEENLPHDVEQLLILPEPVLRGLLVKYHNDEELEVKKIRARYEVFRQRMNKRIYEILSMSTSSTA